MGTEPAFNPFPGLRAFEAEEDYVFFGREKQIDDLLHRLRTTRFLSVIGTSGSGKSSLIRAGLIPALEGGFMTKAGSGWRVAKFRPGADPIGHLADALSQPTVLGTNTELGDTQRVLVEVALRRGTRGLLDVYQQAQISRDENLLVVVDQFEELFRFRRSHQANHKDEAMAFVKLLLEATQQDAPIYVVLTMRSDFIGDCMEYPGLPEAVNAGQYLVPRMSRDELRLAITGPIAVGRAQIAPRFVLRLLNEVGDDQDQLPVLQHALMRTWEHWQSRNAPHQPLDVGDYEAVGTMRHALSIHAEQAYAETVQAGSEHLAERIFKALTDTYSDQRGVRRPTSVQHLVAISGASLDEVVSVVEVFRRPGRSFLMPPASVPLSPEAVVDISHESLMRCWTRLIQWAEQESRSARMYVRIAQASQWHEEGATGLWRDPELELGLSWRRQAQPTAAWARRYNEHFEPAMQFLAASVEERDRQRAREENARKRKLREYQWAAAVLAVLLVATGISFHFARVQRGRAESYLQLAQNAVNEMLSSAGRQQARVAGDVPELDAFRKELLEKARIFYDAFERREPENDEIRAEVARAHFRLGDIDRLLGNAEVAATQYREAVADFARLAQQYPKRKDFRQALANSYNWLGETLRVRAAGRADAVDAYNRALAVQEALVRENPDQADYRRELARTRYNRGIVHFEDGKLDDAGADFVQAINILKALSEHTAEPAVWQELARAYNNLGNLLRFRERPSEAEPLLQQALAIDRKLAAAHPNDRDYRFELATFHDNVALLGLEQQNYASAEENNRRAMELLEDLARPSPSLSMEMANAHNLAAQASSPRGWQAVEAECRRSQQILDRLAQNANVRGRPEFRRLYRDLGYNYLELAQKQLKTSSLAEAQRTLDSCSRIFPELSDADRISLKDPYDRIQQAVQARLSTRK